LTTSFNNYANNGTASLVGPLPKDFGSVTHDDVGVLYFQGLKVVPAPAVASLTTQQNVRQFSSMQAIVDSSGRLIALNAAPGTLGSMDPSYLQGPGQVRFDVNLIKRVRIGEEKEFEFRADAIDVLNRRNFANPDTDINSPNFGRITETIGGNRIVVPNARINFRWQLRRIGDRRNTETQRHRGTKKTPQQNLLLAAFSLCLCVSSRRFNLFTVQQTAPTAILTPML
jgi:hypothetical protein